MKPERGVQVLADSDQVAVAAALQDGEFHGGYTVKVDAVRWVPS